MVTQERRPQLDLPGTVCQTMRILSWKQPRTQTLDNFEPTINQRIWQAVADIPKGKVSTYGAVASNAGLGRAARRVGAALRGLPDNTRIPWHRVINSQGRISFSPDSEAYNRQRSRLEEEGVEFSISGRVNLKDHGW